MTVSAPRVGRRARVRCWLSLETTSGMLLLGAAMVGLLWANSPWRGTHAALAGTVVGPAALHLDLPLSVWAADGLLAVFFFMVGVELKHEIVAGGLRRPREAAVPAFAAIGGMLVPAAVFAALVVALGEPAALHGWAIPTATDIAFALAVLAIFGRGLPRALRTFLLTLAVVDDLLAIIVIAAFYTESIDALALVGALASVVGYGILVRTRRPRWWLLLPIAFLAWGFMHASGVHATIAGVLLGFTVPALAVHGEPRPRTHTFDRAVRPFSAGVALPVFAFFSAGVNVVDGIGLTGVLAQPVFIAVIAGLVLGKLIGVLGTTAVITRLTPLRLPDAVGLRDLLPIGFLTGIGFTVSLLISELSFPDNTHIGAAKLGILTGTLLAAVLGAGTLRWDAHKARTADMNLDGIPDTDTNPIGTNDTDD